MPGGRCAGDENGPGGVRVRGCAGQGLPGLTRLEGRRDLAACALRSAAAFAAAAARAAALAALRSALSAVAASCGVIQLSIGTSAARQTLPWWPPPGMITNGTLATRVSSSCLKSSAALTSEASWAPAASQNAGSKSLTGTLVT